MDVVNKLFLSLFLAAHRA